MILNFIQPIATIHAEDGTLTAIRVFKAKVMYYDDFICPSISEQSVVRFTTLAHVAIQKWLESTVIDISMADISKNKQLRNLLISDVKELINDAKKTTITIHGTYAMPAIKADGTVSNPEIYPVVGSLYYAELQAGQRLGLLIPDAQFIDYNGKTYTAQQLMAKNPALTEYIQQVCHGILPRDGYTSCASLLEDNIGFGNLVSAKARREPNMSMQSVTNYAVNSYAAAVAATQLTGSANLVETKSHNLSRPVTQYCVTDEDMTSGVNSIFVPFGAEEANITAITHNIQRLVLSNSVLSLVYTGRTLPLVNTKTPLLLYDVQAETSGQTVSFPQIRGIVGVSKQAMFNCSIARPTYSSAVVSLLNNIYDAEQITFEVGTQLCPLLMLPVAAQTSVLLPVTMGSFSLKAEHMLFKNMKSATRNRMLLAAFPLERQTPQQILLDLERCDKRFFLTVAAVYADECSSNETAQDIVNRLSLITTDTEAPTQKMTSQRLAPRGCNIKALVNTEHNCIFYIGTRINLTVGNKTDFGHVQLHYVHKTPYYHDISTQLFMANINTMGITVDAIKGVQHRVAVQGNVKNLVIEFKNVPDTMTVYDLAPMIQLYTKNRDIIVKVRIYKVGKASAPLRAPRYAEKYMECAWHDISEFK